MAIEDYFDTLVAVKKFTEGAAPNYEPGYVVQPQFYGMFDKTNSSRVWTDKGVLVKIDAKFICAGDVDITEKDRLMVDDTNSGTPSSEYTIFSIANPNNMGRHFEILLQKV